MIFFRKFVCVVVFVSSPVFSQQWVGESNDYKLTYLSISAVSISLSIPEIVQVDNKKAYRIVAVSKTTSFFSQFYSLENRYETLVDFETGLPIQYHKYITQKTIKQELITQYDHIKNIAHYEGGKFQEAFDIPVQQNTHNFFSMIYSLRRESLQVGQIYRMNLDVETEPWKVEAKVVQKEKIEAVDQEWDAFRVEFKFIPTQEEVKRKKTDILTRRLATSKTRLIFWIAEAAPHPFLKIEFEMSPFSAYTKLVEMKQ